MEGLVSCLGSFFFLVVLGVLAERDDEQETSSDWGIVDKSSVGKFSGGAVCTGVLSRGSPFFLFFSLSFDCFWFFVCFSIVFV